VRRIVIVDDEQLMIDGLAAMLADVPNTKLVGSTTDATKVMEVVRQLDPDLVILDVLMSTGNGWNVASRLKKVRPDVKILGCSTSVAPRVIEDMLKAGARGYITKNEPEGVLERAVQALLSHGPIFLSPRTIEALHDPELRIDMLTEREREVLASLVRDIIPKQVAYDLSLSVKTIYNHIERIRQKAKVNNMIQLYPIAVKEGLLEMPG